MHVCTRANRCENRLFIEIRREMLIKQNELIEFAIEKVQGKMNTQMEPQVLKSKPRRKVFHVTIPTSFLWLSILFLAKSDSLEIFSALNKICSKHILFERKLKKKTKKNPVLHAANLFSSHDQYSN